MPAPKRRRKALTQEELVARAAAKVDALLESDGGSAPPNANKKHREYARRVLVAVAVRWAFDRACAKRGWLVCVSSEEVI